MKFFLLEFTPSKADTSHYKARSYKLIKILSRKQ